MLSLTGWRAVVADFAGMLVAPRSTLQRLGRGEGSSAAWPAVALLLVNVAVNAKILTRFVLLAGHGADTMGNRMSEVLSTSVRTDAAVLVGTCIALPLLAQLLSAGRVKPAHAANAAAWLLVPLLALKAIGGTLDALGLDVWFLPQSAVDSPDVVVGGAVDWRRFALKCAIAYGPPLAIALAWVATFRKPVAVDAPDPRPLPAGVSTTVAVSAGTAPVLPARLRMGALALGVVTLALVAATAVDVVRHRARIRPVLPGDVMPDVTLRELTAEGVSKKKLALSSLRGSVVVLDFWASWCNPCRKSMPELSQISDELGPRGLVVLGVNREPHDPKAAAEALKKIAPHFKSVIDDRGFGDRLGLTTLPTSYVLDRRGVVRHFHLGTTEASVVRGEIQALLAEP